jgi:deoxyribodipyrimidine photo-lyase
VNQPAIMWFRRDLRLRDNPALLTAAQVSGTVLPLFVVDPRLLDGSVRTLMLDGYLGALDDSLGGKLVVRYGDPAVEVPTVAAEVRADSVHISADYGHYGRRRDTAVAEALNGVPLVATGSPYAVAPERITKADGSPYRVYTPFYRAWLRHGWRQPAPDVEPIWETAPHRGLDRLHAHAASIEAPAELPAVGEVAALRRWEAFRTDSLADYAWARDRPDLRGTSMLSADLRFGAIHPRSLLADLDDSEGSEAFRRELAFRDFYADVQWHNPTASWQSLDRRFDTSLPVATGPDADAAFEAWCRGMTGFPFVDAGMRQLRIAGWMHNRVRMVVASFLVKDLHLPWQLGAQWFMARLRDGDVASNSQGWQWAAGCGTDASPYHRVFNPVSQGKKFDPTGEYVRTYVPELRNLPGVSAHEPWLQPLLAPDYPAPMVDHAAERLAALERFAQMKQSAADLT